MSKPMSSVLSPSLLISSVLLPSYPCRRFGRWHECRRVFGSPSCTHKFHQRTSTIINVIMGYCLSNGTPILGPETSVGRSSGWRRRRAINTRQSNKRGRPGVNGENVLILLLIWSILQHSQIIRTSRPQSLEKIIPELSFTKTVNTGISQSVLMN